MVDVVVRYVASFNKQDLAAVQAHLHDELEVILVTIDSASKSETRNVAIKGKAGTVAGYQNDFKEKVWPPKVVVVVVILISFF